MSGASESASGPAHQAQARYEAARQALDLSSLSVKPEELKAATDDRWPFDVVGWELIGRAGQICEVLVGVTGDLPDGARRGLTLDEAVNGGLLVRITKLLRALFDSTQSDESEAHQILARCVAETAVDLRWLLLASAQDYSRFRADSFATWMRILDNVDTSASDSVVQATGQLVVDMITRELADAGLTRGDVPRQAGQWGGSSRQRFDALGEGSLYESFFATHSNYVHSSWHELRAFHLRATADGLELDLTYGGPVPAVLYQVVRLVMLAILEYVDRMPLGDLDLESVRVVARGTVDATSFATLEFARFVAEGGIDEDVNRHLPS